jgi:hypothetical protein
MIEDSDLIRAVAEAAGAVPEPDADGAVHFAVPAGCLSVRPGDGGLAAHVAWIGGRGRLHHRTWDSITPGGVVLVAAAAACLTGRQQPGAPGRSKELLARHPFGDPQHHNRAWDLLGELDPDAHRRGEAMAAALVDPLSRPMVAAVVPAAITSVEHTKAGVTRGTVLFPGFSTLTAWAPEGAPALAVTVARADVAVEHLQLRRGQLLAYVAVEQASMVITAAAESGMIGIADRDAQLTALALLRRELRGGAEGESILDALARIFDPQTTPVWPPIPELATVTLGATAYRAILRWLAGGTTNDPPALPEIAAQTGLAAHEALEGWVLECPSGELAVGTRAGLAEGHLRYIEATGLLATGRVALTGGDLTLAAHALHALDHARRTGRRRAVTGLRAFLGGLLRRPWVPAQARFAQVAHWVPA